jgi:hypothetical protein
MQKDHAVKVGLVGLGSWSLIIADAGQRSKMVEPVACFSRTWVMLIGKEGSGR